MAMKRITCEEIEVTKEGYKIRGLEVVTEFMSDVNTFLDGITRQVEKLNGNSK